MSSLGLNQYSRRSNDANGKGKNLLQRHPIIFGIAILGAAAIIFAPKGKESKKLDFSRPIYTSDSAIICPKSLLFEIRADHGANAVFDVFTSITDRTEKARALGCEVVRGGIPVTVQRMSPPNDDYVAIQLSGIAEGSFFTMAGELENSAVTVDSPQSTPLVQKTLNQSIMDSYEAELSQFQKNFASLQKPMDNLRWFVETPAEGPDAQELSTLLVTPFGPCVDMFGNTAAGYSLMIMDSPYVKPYAANEPAKMLGSYPKRDIAIHAAEKYCRNWYVSETHKPSNPAFSNHLWFTPDEEFAANPDEPKQPDSADDPSQTPAPIERREPPVQASTTPRQ